MSQDPLTGKQWDVWQGDCLDLLKRLPDGCVDAVVTDPPYDARTHQNVTSCAGGSGPTLMVSKTDINFEPLLSFLWLDEAFRISKGWVLAFCSLEMLGGYAEHTGKKYVRSGIWHKPNAAPQFTGDRPGNACEGIAIMHSGTCRKKWNGGGSRGFWSVSTPPGGDARHHPTQKPVALMADLVAKFLPAGGLVLDPFCGSGSTGVACAHGGFRFLGMELDPAYCDIARARIAAAAAQPRLEFDEPQERKPEPKQAGLFEDGEKAP